MDKFLFYFYCLFLFLSKLECKKLEKENVIVFPEYSNNLGNNFKNKEIQSKYNLNLSKESNYNEYSLVSLKANSIFNQIYIARLINTFVFRGFKTFGNFHRNVAIYESFTRTNYFFYLTVLNKKNVKSIVKLLDKSSKSKKKYEVFKKQLISNFNWPNFVIDNHIENEMDQALLIYQKAKTDSYWSLVDALKSDGFLLARTFFAVSFVQSLRGIVGVISHELLDVCFSNAAVFNHIASFDKLFMKNVYGAILGYVFKSFLLFFYPLIIPFRGAFAFVISAFCMTQLSKIIFAIYRKLRQLHRISYRKVTSVIYKLNLNKNRQLQVYSMKLLYGDALIIISKIWKLSYININDHLRGTNIYPVLDNLFEKNLGTGFFDFSQSLYKYVMEALEDLRLIDKKENDISTNFEHKSRTLKTTLLLIKITRRALYYEESYMKLAVASLLTKFYTVILVNIDHISKMNPKEHFYDDIEEKFKDIYSNQINELYLQRIASKIIRKSFIKRNVSRINKGCIEFALAIIKIKLLHYKEALNQPYSSLYFDNALKKQLNVSIGLIIKGSIGIISSLANYGEKYSILKKCPFEMVQNLHESCYYSKYEVKKMLFPIKIFINIVIPLFINYNDVLIDKIIIRDIVLFFKVLADLKDEIHFYKYIKKVVDTIAKERNQDASNINYEEEIEKIIAEESEKVIDEINNDKIKSFEFNDYSVKDGSIYLHNKYGNKFRFDFRDDYTRNDFLAIMQQQDFHNPFKYQVPQITFEPFGSNNGNLIVGSSENAFEGHISPCYLHVEEEDDNLVVDAIHAILWARGVDQFSSYIFSSMIGAVKQSFHQASSWKRALLNMVPTEFYETHRRLLEKTIQEKDDNENIFIKRIRRYKFQFNKESFLQMFRTFLENVLNKINFYDSEEAVIIIVMSALYSIYKNIEKYKIPLNETYKLYQQKLIESYYPVSRYSQNYESYSINLLKKMNKDEIEENREKRKKIKNLNDFNLSLNDNIVRNTKSLQLEIQSREKEKSDILKYLTGRYGEVPHYDNFLHLPSQCLFLLYFNYDTFIQNNIFGIDGVINLIRNRNIIRKPIRNMNIIQKDDTKFSSITHKDLVQILCSTHLFLKKENVTMDDIYRDENIDDVLNHLLIFVSLLRIEKRTDRYSWKRYLTIEKFLDERRRFYKMPLRYFYLKVLKLQRFFVSMRRRVLLSLGKRMKKRRFINILRPTRFFEVMESAESINESYPRAYIKFEDVLIFSNVFHKFRNSIIGYTKDRSSLTSVINDYKLAPNTSKYNEEIILKIFENLNVVIKKKLKIDLHNLKLSKNALEKHKGDKRNYILNELKLNQELEEYLTQLIGFIKLLTDMNFTNHLFLRNVYYFIKFYTLTGDLQYSISSSSIFLCNRGYLNFILNSIIEFENFKKFIEKLIEKHDFRRYHLDPYNFYVQCHASNNIKTYKILLNDQSKMNQYQQISSYDIPSFYKDYLIFNLFYDDIDIDNLNLIYDKRDNSSQSGSSTQSNIYIPGSKNYSQNITFDEIEELNESIKNYLYLEKFLDRTNIPSIPFQKFLAVPDEDRMLLLFTNQATTASIYKDNILDQFTIVGKSIISNYNNKVRCSFVNYPYALYYWLALNPGKPNVGVISKTGLIKEGDLKPETEYKESEEGFKKDEENILGNLFQDPNEIKTTKDVSSNASTSAGGDLEDIISDEDTSNIRNNLTITKPLTEPLNGKNNTRNSKKSLEVEEKKSSYDTSFVKGGNYYSYLEKGNSESIQNENKLKIKENKGSSIFLQLAKNERLTFNSAMLINKNRKIVSKNYGFFNRPYNIYVPERDIFRNFHLVMKLVQSLISLNKFSVITPDSILKRGIQVMIRKNVHREQNLNPSIHKMLLDINKVIQKLKASNEKKYRGPKTNIVDIYKLIEYQLFNEYLIYPPLKRLNEKELRYILEIINEGYYFHIRMLLMKLRQTHIIKEDIVRYYSYFEEFQGILNDEEIELLHVLFQNSLACRNIKCFDNLFNNYIIDHYNRKVVNLLNDEGNIRKFAHFISDENALDNILQNTYNIYALTNRKKKNIIKKINLRNAVYNPQLSHSEFLVSLLEFSDKFEMLHDIFGMFNLRHIYLNIGYMLVSRKYRIKRSLRIFSQKYKFSNFLKTFSGNRMYIP